MGGRGAEDMELPGVLKNKNVEISRVDKEVEFPEVIKKKSCGIFMHPSFWPWNSNECNTILWNCQG